MSACPWCNGAKRVPQLDAGDDACPVCEGDGTSLRCDAITAAEKALNAMKRADWHAASHQLRFADTLVGSLVGPS